MQNYTCFASFFLLPRVLSTSILLSSCKYLDVNGALVCARVLPIPFCSSFRQTSRVVRAPVVTALFEARFAWNSDSQGKPLTYCALDNIFLAKCHFETLVPRAYSFRDSIWVSRLWFWDSMGFETLIPRLYDFETLIPRMYPKIAYMVHVVLIALHCYVWKYGIHGLSGLYRFLNFSRASFVASMTTGMQRREPQTLLQLPRGPFVHRQGVVGMENHQTLWFGLILFRNTWGGYSVAVCFL